MEKEIHQWSKNYFSSLWDGKAHSEMEKELFSALLPNSEHNSKDSRSLKYCVLLFIEQLLGFVSISLYEGGMSRA